MRKQQKISSLALATLAAIGHSSSTITSTSISSKKFKHLSKNAIAVITTGSSDSALLASYGKSKMKKLFADSSSDSVVAIVSTDKSGNVTAYTKDSMVIGSKKLTGSILLTRNGKTISAAPSKQTKKNATKVLTSKSGKTFTSKFASPLSFDKKTSWVTI